VRFIDRTGHKIGPLTVLECLARRPSKWRCECECGNARVISGVAFKKWKNRTCKCLYRDGKKTCGVCGPQPMTEEFWYYRDGRPDACRTCQSRRGRQWYADNIDRIRVQAAESVKRRKVTHWWTNLFQHSRDGAKRREIEFAITTDDILFRHKLQGGRCYYTNAVFEYSPEPWFPTFPSIDRFDSSKGYVVGNIVLCCRWVNRAKGELEAGEFARLLSEIDLDGAPITSGGPL
jgi:hypothetical protein